MNQNIRNNAKKLRQRETKAEILLWDKIRAKKLNDLKFRRQVPIEFEYEGRDRVIFVDFVCFEKRLIIELDGSSHDDKKEQDKLRDRVCESLGFTVLRFENSEVYTNIENVLARIKVKF